MTRSGLRVRLLDGLVAALTWDNTPVLDGVYVTVRDEDWRTLPGRCRARDVHRADGHLVLTWTAEHLSGDGTPVFRYDGELRRSADEATIAIDGRLLRAFRGRRIGLCALFLGEWAGQAFAVDGPAGRGAGRFPRRIAPHPIASGIASLTTSGPAASTTIEFEGGLVEVEDHRNWLDAGWKAYSPPLQPGPPTLFAAGERISQRCRVHVAGPSGGRRRREVVRLTEADEPPAPVPAVGTAMPEVDGARIVPWAEHVWAEVVEGVDWTDRLDGIRRAVDRPLRLTIAYRNTAWLDKVAEHVGTLPTLAAVTVVAAATGTTRPGDVRRTRAAVVRGGRSVPIGGGSLLHFAELNRLEISTDDWDFAAFAATPQNHHDSGELIMAGLSALPDMIDTARRIVPGRPVSIAPLAFRARRGPFEPPHVGDPIDPREREQLASAWWLAALAQARGAATMSLLGTADSLDRSGVGRLVGAELVGIAGGGRSVAAVGVRAGEHRAAHIANLRRVPVLVEWHGRRVELAPYGTAVLDGSSADGSVS